MHIRSAGGARAVAVSLIAATCALLPAVSPAGATTPTYWRIVANPFTGNGYAVSCASPTSCVAIQNGGGSHASHASVWNGTSWTSPAAIASGYFFGFALSVSCPTTTFCMAVGGANDNPVTETWDGTSWTDQPTPGGEFASLYAVSCPSTTFCLAAGNDVNGDLAVAWNGTTWTAVTSPPSLVIAMSCASATSCRAIAAKDGGEHVIDAWNGTTWTETTSPVAALRSISCATTTSCMAVGGSGATAWNGTSWSAVTTAPRGNNLNLVGVSCPAASSCIAAGFDIGPSGDSRTLVESWDGAAWTLVPSPNTGIGPNLAAVSCSSATSCVGVGSVALVSDPANPAPGPPSAPAAVQAGPRNGAASVSLTPGDDGASFVTSYSATCTSSNGGATGSGSRDRLPVVVSGLTNLKTYRCTARATNALGTSSASSPSGAFVPARPAGAPHITAVANANGKATVHWSAAATNGSPITGYRINVFSSKHGHVVTTAPPSGRSAVFVLPNGSRAEFTVQARNLTGYGPVSNKIVVTIGTPLAPTSLVASAGHRSATLDWKASGTNGAPISGYAVTPYKTGVAQPVRMFHSTATHQVLTGLTTGTVYTFRVAARNVRGVGTKSAASKPITPT